MFEGVGMQLHHESLSVVSVFSLQRGDVHIVTWNRLQAMPNNLICVFCYFRFVFCSVTVFQFGQL